MYRIMITVALLFVISFSVYSCENARHNDETDTGENTNETVAGYISFDHSSSAPPTYTLLLETDMVLVEWGEPVLSVVHDRMGGYEGDFIGYSVKYVNIIESTMHESYLEGLSNPGERFDHAENGAELEKLYDDVILLPDICVENIKKGDVALIMICETSIEFDRKEIPYYAVSYSEYIPDDVGHRVGIFPISDGKLEIPENMSDEGVYTYFAYPTMLELKQVNQRLQRVDETYPIFETGLPLEDIEKYFDIATDPDTFPY